MLLGRGRRAALVLSAFQRLGLVRLSFFSDPDFSKPAVRAAPQFTAFMGKHASYRAV